jgi:uncharacterized protein YdeI (YjbR/CyaY-like superfamily)
MLTRIRADESAWAAWHARPASFRRQATYWILSGKRSDTRERRFATLVTELAAGRLPRPFLVTRQDRAEVDR